MPGFLNDEQVAVLKQAYKQIKDKKLADRIKVVVMLHHGFTYSQITQALMLDEVTLRRYVKRFQNSGLDGLLECRYSGGRSRLTSTQETEFKTFLQTNTQRTAQSVVQYVRETSGMTFSVIGITKLLHHLDFSYKKPKIVPGKADPVKQAAFLKMYRKLKRNLKENDRIYFADSTHPEHNTKPSYGWILKGRENDKFVKTNSGRERLNLSGALNKLVKLHPRGKIHLVLDNATYYHAAEVKVWLTHHYRFKLHFLPSYSPNLNLIERLWRFFHLKVTWNHYFASFDEFKKESLKFFKHLSRYGPELNTLLADNFQLVPDINLQT